MHGVIVERSSVVGVEVVAEFAKKVDPKDQTAGKPDACAAAFEAFRARAEAVRECTRWIAHSPLGR